MNNRYTSDVLDCYIKDGIMYGIYLCTTITLEAAQKVVEQRLIIREGKAYPGLADIRNIKTVIKEARIFFARRKIMF